VPKKAPEAAARSRKPDVRSRKPKSFYKSPPPKPGRASRDESREPKRVGSSRCDDRTAQRAVPTNDIPHAHLIPTAPFTLREDGSIESSAGVPPASASDRSRSAAVPAASSDISPESRRDARATLPRLIFHSDNPFIRLYHGNCLELLDAIYATYGDAGRFDAIFADPPYFLSNGGITCHAGKMVKVDKGDWDVSRGPELNHEFNTEWLRRCQRVLKPNGTIWVTGTHHVIFSIGYALQQLGFKILNDIAWEKPNPPPNLSCRYFTHSTETVLWAAKNEKSKHVFNYQEMRKVTGKQMKTVWRNSEFQIANDESKSEFETRNSELEIPNVWTMTAPSGEEKRFGKHPTQKPVALIERCLLASTNEGDLVLDPFLGGGTTAVVSLRLKRGCVGVELDLHHAEMAVKRVKGAIESGTDLFSSQVPGGGVC
jgi:site-specific DNA-methyltransferase (adenine-specific)